MSRKEEYIFTGEIKKEVESFKNHLQKQYLNTNTIRQKSNYAGYFLNWCETENLQPSETRYNDLLNFIDYCKLENKSNYNVNRIIASVRDYYKFLKTTDPSITNPAVNLYLKGNRHKVISGVIDFKELENLYQNFKSETLRDKRNKAILGLLIYQAVTTEELHRLEPGHLKLKEGKIYIPGNRRRNSRTLELKPFQILELHEYITKIRHEIINEITPAGRSFGEGWKPKPARKPEKIDKTKLENQLFISINGSGNIKNSLIHLFKAIQKTNPPSKPGQAEIQSAEQIRKSVITYWLKTHNLRQVQYMAGHRWVSSTERYQVNNLENLQNKLEKYHPLNHN